MSEALLELAAHLEAKQSDAVLRTEVVEGELVVWVSVAAIPGFVEFIKTDRLSRFSSLVDITAVDYPTRAKRF